MPTKTKHPEVCAVLRAKHTDEGPLTVDDCKSLIGWTEEPDDKDWEKDYALKDLYGQKIRLTNNTRNRPFKRPLADRYANEHVRGKWALNLETIVVASNGMLQQGQHRLVGLILGEQIRQIDPNQWGKAPLVYEVLVGYGVSSKPETANTYDLGAKRSLGDVLYRHEKFAKGTSAKKQRGTALILAGAIRLVWLRVGGKQVSFAPHFPHSEALEFYGEHPDILQSVMDIVGLDGGEEGNEKCISSLVSLSYAAGLLYLMERAETRNAAIEFWTAFASGEGLKKGSPILSLRQLLVRMDATSGGKRDEVIGAVVKAWLLWSNGRSGTTKEVKVPRKKDGDRFVLSEFPRIGGIDDDVEMEVTLTQHQLLVLSILKKTRKEVGYDYLRERTGLQTGTLANSLMKETKRGNENPHSLVSRKLVRVAQYESENGEGRAPYVFQLTKKGKAQVA